MAAGCRQLSYSIALPVQQQAAVIGKTHCSSAASKELVFDLSVACGFLQQPAHLVSACVQTTDCNGVTSTATVTLKYELPVVVNADSYSYSASPYTVTAAAGLLANDVNPASCVAQGKALTAVRTSAPASGTVTVSTAWPWHSCKPPGPH